MWTDTQSAVKVQWLSVMCGADETNTDCRPSIVNLHTELQYRGPLLGGARLQHAGSFKGKQRKKIGVLNVFSRINSGRCKKSDIFWGNFQMLIS